MSRCSGHGYDCGDSSAHPENRYREPSPRFCAECVLGDAVEGSDYCEDCEAYQVDLLFGGPKR